MARSEDGLLRTLLYQILDSNPEMVPYVCPRRWSLFHAARQTDGFPPWTTWELEESFERFLQREEDGPRLAIFIELEPYGFFQAIYVLHEARYRHVARQIEIVQSVEPEEVVHH